MEKRDDKIVGDLDVAGSLHLRGMVTGVVTVLGGGYLELDGMVASLSVLDGGRAIVRGTVQGDVTNGGDVQIAGVVHGGVHDVGGGTTAVVSGAVIGGVTR